MDNKSRKRGLLSIVSLILIMFLIPITVWGKVKGDIGKDYKDNLYLKVVSFNMPSLGVSNEINGTSVSNIENISIKNMLMNTLGIYSLTPTNILQKEISYLNTSSDIDYSEGQNEVADKTQDQQEKDNENDSGEKVVIEPFEIKDDEVAKVNSTDKSNEGDTTSVMNNNSEVKKKTPRILIYHTHTSEAYKPGEVLTYDEKYSVVAVGNKITDVLMNKYGINVIHDKTVHDKSYNDSYYKSGDTLDKYLKQYGNFDVIIDLHRDSLSEDRDSESDRKLVTTEINGESVAKYMFVTAKKNPHYEKNRALMETIVRISNKMYPGLIRDVEIYDKYNYGIQFFNQNKSSNAVLVEVGAACTEINEAVKTGEYLGEILGEYIKEKDKQ